MCDVIRFAWAWFFSARRHALRGAWRRMRRVRERYPQGGQGTTVVLDA